MRERLKRFCRDQILFGLAALRDIAFYPALALGFTAWVLPEPNAGLPWTKLALLALYEEIIFRMLLQEGLRSLFQGRILAGPLSLANLCASAVFALAHFVHHPPGWALAVFVPSIVFGWAWDRYRSVIPCSLLHFVYNFLYFYRLY